MMRIAIMGQKRKIRNNRKIGQSQVALRVLRTLECIIKALNQKGQPETYCWTHAKSDEHNKSFVGLRWKRGNFCLSNNINIGTVVFGRDTDFLQDRKSVV